MEFEIERNLDGKLTAKNVTGHEGAAIVPSINQGGGRGGFRGGNRGG